MILQDKIKFQEEFERFYLFADDMKMIWRLYGMSLYLIINGKFFVSLPIH